LFLKKAIHSCLLPQLLLSMNLLFVCLLQTHELYYLHAGTGKRAKRDPRELVRQADESVRARVRRAQFRFDPKADCVPEEEPETSSSAASSSDWDTSAVSAALTAAASSETTDSTCSEASSSSLLANGQVVVAVEPAADCKEKKKRESDESSGGSSGRETTGMVALGCRHCSMFVMLSLSSPLCPSCGESLLHAAADDDDDDKDG
jgi:hypothetical protein